MIPKHNKNEHIVLPVTSIQNSMLVHTIFDKCPGIYQIQLIVDLPEVINTRVFNKAWQATINRHEALRTYFSYSQTRKKSFRLQVKKTLECKITEIILTNIPAEKRKRKLNKIFNTDRNATLDVTQAPLYRFLLIKYTNNHYYFLWTLHHSIMGGESVVAVLIEAFTRYDAMINNKHISLPRIGSFAPYYNFIKKFDQKSACAYWKQLFTGFKRTNKFEPIKKNELPQNEVESKLNRQQLNMLQQFAKNYDCTLGTLYQAAWGLLVAQLTHSEDIVFGNIRAFKPELTHNVAGMFINTLPVRLQLSRDMSIEEYLQQVKFQQKKQNELVQTPLTIFHDILETNNDPELFNTVIDIKKLHPDLVVRNNLETWNKRQMTYVTNTHYPLSLELYGLGTGIGYRICYLPQYFTRKIARNITRYYKNILLKLVDLNTAKISDISSLSDKEQSALLQSHNRESKKNFCGNLITVDKLFYKTVAKYPNKQALIFNDSALTYYELNKTSNKLARELLYVTNKQCSPVVIYLDNGINVIVAMLAIIKSGKAYIPFDTNAPIARTEVMISDCLSDTVITSKSLKNRFESNSYIKNIICIDDEGITNRDDSNLNTQILATESAYIIYTSGSTGNPKGVVIKHSSLANLVLWHKEEYNLSSYDKLSQLANISFDAATWSIWVALSSGSSLFIADEATRIDPSKLLNWHVDNKITHSFVPTPIAQILANTPWPQKHNLKVMLTGGDVLHKLSKTQNTFKIANHYGPTENTVVTTMGYIDSYSKKPHIGKAINNIELYILDKYLRIVPPGFAGELYIGGVGLANGYWNNSQETNLRFIENPFKPESKLYRSGDLVRLRDDGNFDFVGRVDDQIKILGYRIEIGEIESVLSNYKSIQSAAVIPYSGHNNDGISIIAYVVFKNNTNSTSNDLLSYSSKHLPAYMVPKQVFVISTMPLTKNGKIDKTELQELYRHHLAEQPAPVLNDDGYNLAKIWSKVLNIPLNDITTTSNFFALGGDSIASFKVVAEAAKFGIYIKHQEIFQNPTLVQLQSAVLKNYKTIKTESIDFVRSKNIPLSPIQRWFFANYAKKPNHFNQLCTISLNTALKPKILNKVFEYIINHYDAFLLCYSSDKKSINWKQYYSSHEALKNTLIFQFHDLSLLANAKQHNFIVNNNTESLKYFDLSEPPLIRINYYKLGVNKSILFISIHHLIVDGVSWRIILDTLFDVYAKLKHKESVLLLPTAYYGQWVNKISENLAANKSMGLKSEGNILNSQVRLLQQSNIIKSNAENHTKLNTFGNSTTIIYKLKPEITKRLRFDVYNFNQTRVLDVLLTSLLLSLSTDILLDVEEHGRDIVDGGLDVSRTIGWFTNIKPLQLKSIDSHDIAMALQYIKEMQQSTSPPTNDFEKLQNSIVAFNYLGYFGIEKSQSTDLDVEDVSLTLDAGADMQRTHLIDINCLISNNELVVEWTYCSELVNQQEIIHTAKLFMSFINKIVSYCTSKGTSNKNIVAAINNRVDDTADKYPLTPLQQGIFYYKYHHLSSECYHIQALLDLYGNINERLFRAAWQSMINKYDSLRTTFAMDNNSTPMQFTTNSQGIEWHTFDLRRISPYKKKIKLQEIINSKRQILFNLEKSPLIRFYLIRLSKFKYTFMITYHHIIIDGWSFSNILNDALTTYDKLLKHARIDNYKPTSYKEYADWIKSQNFTAGLEYWRNYLSDFKTKASLSIEHNRENNDPGLETTRKSYAIKISSNLSNKFKSFVKSNSVTLNTLFQAGLGILIQRYSNSDDIIFGVTASSRPNEIIGSERMVGLLITTSPTRVHDNNNQTVIEFMRNFQMQESKSREFSYIPLNRIQQLSGIRSNDNLFDILYIFENYPAWKTTAHNLKLRKVSINESNHYKLTIQIVTNEQISILYSYDINSFGEIAIKYFHNSFIQLLENMALNPNALIKNIPIVTRLMTKTLLGKWNATDTNFPSDKHFIKLFEDNVAANPNAIALFYQDNTLTYGQLNSKANQIAHIFLELKIHKNQLISIFLERGIEYVTTVLAILKIGCSYLPLETQTPAARMAYIIEDSQVKVLITAKSLLANLPSTISNIRVITIDTLSNELASQPVSNLPYIPNSEQDIYVLYTSGSTGKPKGVVIKNNSVINFLYAMKKLIAVTSDDVFLAMTAFTFDISGLELYLPLLFGAKTAVVDYNTIYDTYKIIAAINKYNITVIQATPTSWRMLTASGWHPKANMKLLSGGEVLTRDLADKLVQKDIQLWNVYGPTETTIWSTACQIKKSSTFNRLLSIGKPLANTQVYILDKQLNLLPPGVAGELYIGGHGLAREYLHNPSLTNEKFINNPFSGNSFDKIYKTGDIAKWDYTGNIIYMGRIDDQIKIHGFRIELSEIEITLAQHPMISQCAVICEENSTNDKYIIAYVAIKTDPTKTAPSTTELRRYLSTLIPYFMIPSHFVFLSSLPTTSSNKIDKKSLPKFVDKFLTIKKSYVAPQNDLETTVSNILSQSLHLPASDISMNDDFFELGGDSISAMQTIDHINNSLNCRLKLNVLFEASTIADLCNLISSSYLPKLEQSSADKVNLTSNLVTLQPNGNKLPLFIIHPIGGTVFCYKALADNLDQNHPVYAIQDPGIDAQNFLFSSLSEMSQSYFKLIKEIQPSGPYYLAGASFGGNVAVEITNMLHAQGEQVKFLGLMDGWAIYPAKVNHDYEWFKQNLLRQHRMMQDNFKDAYKIPEHIIELNWHRQQMLAKHVIQRNNYPITLFKSATLSPVLKPIAAELNHWDEYTTSKIKLHIVPGNHETILQHPNVKTLAKLILKYLD